MLKYFFGCYVFLCAVIFSMTSGAAQINTRGLFNVLTYNVQMRPILDDNDHKSKHIGKRINHFDIVGIQESFAAKDQLMSYCTLQSKNHFTDKKCFFNLVHSGLSTLSRYPALFAVNEHYVESANLVDKIAAKGIMLVRYEINDCTVDVYNTHMQASDGEDGHRARIAQARQLVDFVKRHSPASHSVIVLGDFNMNPFLMKNATEPLGSKHYDDEQIGVLRGYAFSIIQKGLGLSDLASTLGYEESDDIDRILFRKGSNHAIEAISMVSLGSYFTDHNNEPLSDGNPLLGMFYIERLD